MPTSEELLQAILDKLNQPFEAKIAESLNSRPRNFQRISIDLSSARLETDPYFINFPLRSIAVESASDSDAFVYLKPHGSDTGEGYIKLRDNSSLNLGDGIAKAALHWDAQSGKTITLVIFVDAEFRSGRNISVNAGGISINDGSANSLQTPVALTAGTSAIIAPALGTRKVATLQNRTGSDIYVGDASVTATNGVVIPADGIFKWRNTSALYGLATVSGNVVNLEEA